MSDKPDWFKMDPSKFMQDCLVETMSTLELGMAFRLLCRQWIDGSVPDDRSLLARLCRVDRGAMDEAWPVISSFFPEIEKGKRANRFMWVERETVLSAMKKREEDGRTAVNKRWDAIRREKEGNRLPIADLIQDIEEDTEKEKEKEKEVIPLQPSASASSPSGKEEKKERKPRKVQTTALKDGSVKSFEAAWETVPKTFRKWDAQLREYVDEPIPKGSRLEAERNFQAIVDSKVATPQELYYAFYAYITEGEGPAKGFYQALSTFCGPRKATYLQWIARGQELALEAQ